MSSTPTDNSVGLNAAVGSTASLGMIFIGAANYLPDPYGKILTLVTPILSSVLSWCGIYFYNRLMEPPAVVALRSGYKKDLQEQLNIINDDNCDDETRASARQIYSATRLKMATLRQDYAAGKLKVTTLPDEST
ncbi:hypothetical protein [Xenorhabdus bovienii]|uniref:hypothetical protein n=1 Tax=Xenorhabdus bovienii TaxID=40576 RepID=UPI0023B339EB|nr:hypothetical protein [Xenorhabdus bovienii]MDE9458800.1 hypothetical protein [Xenorhabdus bovienii]MDE9487151.1 hypothetical protein [Xenorhabdus bovienii]MDE9515031.1 hypothetical protein [Xenorhabdus bovienii]MDE9538112.1 hypothetical protein [Xenorhabdus bovienii]MDE9549449.1 hypothetical protein [Xenorhabdus bovienii]